MRDELAVQGVTRTFGDRTALDAVSFTVRPGRMTGFVGANGAGKTTTMRIILGVLAPDAGQVTLGGVPLTLPVRRRFGYMPEERGLYPKMKVGDQLRYLAELHGLDRTAAARETDAWLERLGIAERAGDRVEELSLGNQQRVQLGAALVGAPELLILDEPFSGLDPVGVDVLSEVLLERVAQGVPVVFSSHQLELVERLCDRVAIVAHGRLVASGRVDELRAAGHRRVRVDVVDAGSDWAAAVPGVRLLEKSNGQMLLELDDDVPLDGVLDRARAAGAVTHFSLVQPTLADLFREAVNA